MVAIHDSYMKVAILAFQGVNQMSNTLSIDTYSGLRIDEDLTKSFNYFQDIPRERQTIKRKSLNLTIFKTLTLLNWNFQ